ncbi:beta-ketoacyl synthase N-terminal-like domain-containing protein [Streptomyces roseoverticillatus]|uniref:type I polyketide synthase n=1 Tax=Streptomyces roseoverticillatus TaxID=66429 RepID=UPI0033D49EF3
MNDPRPGGQPPAAEPVAVVGMACRLPGGIDTPDELWEFVLAGKDAIGEIPPDRWEAYERRGPDHARAVRNTTSRGGFLADAAGFDADFFGITPREAELMDPQQRIVLELAWEALEHAGLPPHALAGSDAGVFMGVGSDDYGRRLLEDLPRIEGWTGIGAAPCAVANRVSYTLDLRGPSLAVDTACSSSLAAIHLACTALRDRESTVALAGGVNVMAAPGLTRVLDAAGATSPNGRSRPFDAEADGYVRGEGAGVVVLKRLADALRDGDRVLAVIRGSAVSQDGRTNGIMAPNGEAQEHVARLALERAGIAPRTVDYVEAHGTGTRAGDPIEAAALSAVFGADRPREEPCLIGSVKGNIGHLEAGAGIAGVIKSVLALWHGEIPPQAGFTTPNPAVPWETSGLRVVDERTPWPATGRPRRAGVSAFGYGGTVTHVVLEQAPEPSPAAPVPSPATAPALYPLSGSSPEAVRAYAGRLADELGKDAGPRALADLRHTLWRRRTHLPHRAAVVAQDGASLRYELRKLAADQPTPATTTGRARPTGPDDAVWVFSGHGAQWAGMGRDLLADEPAFAEVIDAIDPVFREELGFSARRALQDGELGTVDRVQALLFAVQVGTAAVWRELGLRPAAVIGHSVGEVAAAVVAGVFGLTEGARLICRRSVQVGRAAGGGAMALTGLPFDTVAARLAGDPDVVAAIQSSPASTVVAGTPDGVAAFAAQCEAEGVTVRTVASDVAFHSPQMDPLLKDLRNALSDLIPARPAVPVYSTALTDPRSGAPRDGDYWAANLRNPVRLSDAVTAAVEDGHRLFLEVSAHPVVAHSIGETLEHLGTEDTCVAGSLRRGRPAKATLLTALGLLHSHGCAVDLERQGTDGTLTTLPRTAWQDTRFWREAAADDAWAAHGHDAASRTLLGTPFTVPGSPPLRVWRTRLDLDNRPYPGRHPVEGVEIVPAAVLLGTLFAAAGEQALSDVAFVSPVTVAPPRELQVLDRNGTVAIVSRPHDDVPAGEDDGGDWQTHTTAVPGDPGRTRPDVAPADLWARCGERLDAGAVNRHLRTIGISDTGFRWTMEELARGDGELTGRVRPGDTDGPDAGAEDAWPAVLDALLSMAPMAFEGEPRLRIVSGIRRAALTAPLPEAPLLHVRKAAGQDGGLDAIVTDDDGRVLGYVDGLQYSVLGGEIATSALGRRGLVHRPAWRAVTRSPRTRPLRTVVLVGDDPRTAGEAARQAGAAGVRCVAVPDAARLPGVLDGLDDRDAVVLLSGAGAGAAVAERAEERAWELVAVAQAIAARGLPRPPVLWCVTTGLREGEGDDALTQSPLWGLGRVIGGEHPDFWGGAVDLAEPGPHGPEEGVRHLFGLLTTQGEADVFAPRAGVLEALRLVTLDGPPERSPLACRPDATYLVTGGLGSLGLRVADWLVGRGARRLLLAGRTGLPPRSLWDGTTDPAVRRRIEAVRALEAKGATVRATALDVTDAAAVAAALDTDALGLPPVRGVVHAAGALDDRLLGDVTRDSLRTVMRPKAAGALVLDELFPPGSVDFLALFSSAGQFLGLAGQASYAAANAFLDGLARRRAGAGHDDVLSLCWTSWRGTGMAVSDVVDEGLRNAGVSDISQAEAFLAWDHASRYRLGQAAVFRTVPGGTEQERLPVLRELDFGAAAETGAPVDDVARTLAALEPEQRRAWMLAEVAGHVAAETQKAAEKLDVQRPLAALGIDSVITLAIRNRLEKRLRRKLPATLLWNLPTVAAIADHLLGLVETPAPGDETAVTGAPAAGTETRE